MSSGFRFGLGAAALASAAFGAAPSAAEPPRAIGELARPMWPPVARCLIEREPAMVEDWLRTLPGSAEEERLVRSAEPRFPACFGELYGLNGSVWLSDYDRAGMRRGLVRALLQARRDDLPAEPPAAAAQPWYDPRRDAARSAGAAVAADLGACLARKHWQSVVAIVRAVDPKTEHSMLWLSPKAKATLKREAAAADSELSKIVPSIAGCVPAGTRLRLDRASLRSLLEEAAYHMIADDHSTPVQPFRP
jgi:hypothetical protein